MLFKEAKGEESPAQIKAFTDTWQWTLETERTFEQEIIYNPQAPSAVKDMITALRQFVGQNPMMAYLVMMTPRLVELHRALKPTGSLYLHCDPTASHYLKIVLDTVFGKDRFRNEIVWRRTGSHNQNRRYGPIHDTLFFYTKSNKYSFNTLYRAATKGHVDSYFKKQDNKGRYWTNALTGAGTRNGKSGEPWRGYDPSLRGRHWAVPGELIRSLAISEENSVQDRLEALFQKGYIDLPSTSSNAMPTFRQYLTDSPSIPLQDIWAYQPYTRGALFGTDAAIDEDIRWMPRQGTPERLGYATQKPEGLLERIIEASSNEGDVVLDPFCGCGTAVAAAQKLNRQWIGIDITHLAVALMKNRLKTMFNLDPGQDYEVVGEPEDAGSARALWEQDPYQFQFWAVSLLEAQPQSEQRRGPDRGIDGQLYFIDGPRRTPQKVIIQVKGGHVSSPQVRDLKGVVEREKAALGLFITLEEPTRDMRTEAASGGFFHSDLWNQDYPRIQLRTVAQLLESQSFELPPRRPMYQPAERVRHQRRASS